jgi:hypothetical protein
VSRRSTGDSSFGRTERASRRTLQPPDSNQGPPIDQGEVTPLGTLWRDDDLDIVAQFGWTVPHPGGIERETPPDVVLGDGDPHWEAGDGPAHMMLALDSPGFVRIERHGYPGFLPGQQLESLRQVPGSEPRPGGTILVTKEAKWARTTLIR